MVAIVANFVWSTTLVWHCALSGADLEISRSSASSARPVLTCWPSMLPFLCAGFQASSTQQTARAALGWGQVVISRMPFPSPRSKSRPRVRALSPGEPLPIKAARSQSTRSLALPNMRELLTSKRDAQPATLADMPGPKKTVPVRSPSGEESSTTSEPLAEKARHKLLARRSRRRLRAYVDQLFESRPGQNPLSLLERAVTAKTAEYYEKEYQGKLDYRRRAT